MAHRVHQHYNENIHDNLRERTLVFGITGLTGFTGQSSIPLHTGPTGPVGVFGVFVNTGPTGLPGWATNTGATGVPGIAENPGHTGAQGPVGSMFNNTGETGPTGLPGWATNTGVTGPTGLPGWATNTGLFGETGVTGPTGAILSFNTGATGPSGLLIGPTGNHGSLFNTGPVGPVGQTGITGITGPTGITGISILTSVNSTFFQSLESFLNDTNSFTFMNYLGTDNVAPINTFVLTITNVDSGSLPGSSNTFFVRILGGATLASSVISSPTNITTPTILNLGTISNLPATASILEVGITNVHTGGIEPNRGFIFNVMSIY